MAYALIDDVYSLNEKYDGLQREMMKRYLKRLITKSKKKKEGVVEEKFSLGMKDLMCDIIHEIEYRFSLVVEKKGKEGGEELPIDFPEQETDEFGTPLRLLAVAHGLRDIMKPLSPLVPENNYRDHYQGRDGEEVGREERDRLVWEKARGWVLGGKGAEVLRVLVVAAYHALVTASERILPDYLSWKKTMAFCYVWFALGSYPVGDLMQTYRGFEEPKEFQGHVGGLLEEVKGSGGLEFGGVMCSWVEKREEGGYDYVMVGLKEVGEEGEGKGKEKEGENEEVRERPRIQTLPVNLLEGGAVLVVKRWRGGEEGRLEEEELTFEEVAEGKGGEGLVEELWARLLRPVLGKYGWKGRRSKMFGLDDIDWDIVKALKDEEKYREALEQNQISEYLSAKSWKKKQYLPFIPPPPEVKHIQGANVVFRPEGLPGKKPHLGICFLGHVDSGKSTYVFYLLLLFFLLLLLLLLFFFSPP